jgi:NAD(P)H-hydrate epimerase
VKPIITPEESSRLDSTAVDSVDVLMERAGLGVALAAVREGARYGKRVILLAGPGNNGGDAYVAARYLRRRGVAAEVRALGYPRGDDSPARFAAAAAVSAGVLVEPLGKPEPCDLLVDGLFGAGFRGTLGDEAAAWTGHPAPVVAVDLPSGLQGGDGLVDGPAFRAVRTVTFHALKVGHVLGEGPDRTGEIDVVDIGLTGERPALRLCERADAPLPRRERTAHKWSAGSVLVCGGSDGLGGAAMLTARAALGFGAGAVRIACPAGLQSAYSAMDPGVMTTGIGSGDRWDAGDGDAVLDAAGRFDVLALGPGMGRGSGPGGVVGRIVSGWDGPLVIDADGLNAVDAGLLAARSAPTVVTPHAGEFRRLAGTDPGWEAAAAFARETKVTVVLKGNPTIVAGEDIWVVASGGPELATIGTGDVLTGMIAALWARGLDEQTAARSAAYHHGAAGRALAQRATVTATTLAAEIGEWPQ